MRRSARVYKFSGASSSEELRRRLREEYPKLLVQAVDSSAASNERSVEMVGEQTLEAGAAGSPLAKKPEVDLLMRLAGTTQISRAIQKVGVKAGREFLLVIVGDAADIRAFESKDASAWKRIERRKLDVEDMRAIERAALLNAEKA